MLVQERSDSMTNAAENPRSDQELEAREALMREEFKRQKERWDEAVPVEEVLRKLKARIVRGK
jgi:hypothetical protein